jgi:hypothetical protein
MKRKQSSPSIKTHGSHQLIWIFRIEFDRLTWCVWHSLAKDMSKFYFLILRSSFKLMHDVYNIQYLTGTERIKVAKVAVKNDVYAILLFDLEVHESSSSSCRTRYCFNSLRTLRYGYAYGQNLPIVSDGISNTEDYTKTTYLQGNLMRKRLSTLAVLRRVVNI